MTKEEKALIYFKDLRERKAKDYSAVFNTAPKDSVVYEALSAEIEIYDTTIKALEKKIQTWSLDDARDDFVSDVYDTLDFLPTNNEANKIIDIFDRVTSGIKQESVFNKIRAEISKTWYTQPKNRYEEGLKDQALKDMKIIDKYKKNEV